jgi:hypothetical protein
MPINFNDPNYKLRAPRDRHDSVGEIFGAGGKLLDTGRLVDFSKTGAAFFSLRVMKAGDCFKLRVRLLERGVLDISAQVVWTRKEGAGSLYGLKFESVLQVYPSGEMKKAFE